VTAALYGVFLVLAAIGLMDWRRSFARDHAAAIEPATHLT
jgi:hypothetical protein